MKRTLVCSLFALIMLANFSWVDAQVSTTPNYAKVFPQNQLNKITISISKADWDSIKIDMKEKFNTEFGKSPFPRMGPPNGERPNQKDFPSMSQDGKRPEVFPPQRGGDGEMMPPPMGTSDEPRYVACAVEFEGKKWTNIGFRLKGNSSLMSSWGAGVYKMPFRLDFDKYEKSDLYGFHELSMSPAFHDNTLIREKLASDIYRQAGIPTAQTAFYEVYLDYGDGVQYAGVYTMVEVIDDTMISTQFGNSTGNIYKPESTFQRFREKEFEKKNFKKEKKFQDVQSFVRALNDSSRLVSPAQWRSNLEKTFDMKHFIKWLAINTAMTNWDTYGAMAHNFYLYNAPNRGLVWIPWDNNEAISTNNKPNFPIPEGMPEPPKDFRMPNRGLALSLKDCPKQFVLIAYLAQDPTYYGSYLKEVETFRKNTWQATKLNKQVDGYVSLIKQAASREKSPYSHLTNEKSFEEGIQSLQKQIVKRASEIDQFLAEKSKSK